MDFETLKNHRSFKKDILDVVFTHCETFYIHCMPCDELIIGRRGLLEKEHTEGIILVFGPHSNRNLSWDEDCIYSELQFSTWESVKIPYECISRVFDKSGQVVMQWATIEIEKKPEQKRICRETNKKTPSVKKEGDSRVIEVDFRNKKD